MDEYTTNTLFQQTGNEFSSWDYSDLGEALAVNTTLTKAVLIGEHFLNSNT